ncbi:Aminoglycoside phosphotransferase [Penicillium taxi]|uniref:Aminoglycoside phosphotransferase n=1 Tax=Penicillium taxi TaxID=168475 RepID=UPI002545BCCC|nr:Aminoglycoside phosphotransferase [Penicillium taxi]KAJ5899608.1 Aminoglycoside phosphotransferase [Penicillium taxi]
MSALTAFEFFFIEVPIIVFSMVFFTFTVTAVLFWTIIWFLIISPPATSNLNNSIEKFPLDGLDISLVSDETLIKLFKTAPVLHGYQGTRIARLSESSILKGGSGSSPCEARILEIIAKAEPSIRVPTIHRVLKIKECFYGYKCLIWMDFVSGRLVQDCWEDLSRRERKDIASQVATSLNILHSISLPDQIPGPILPGPIGPYTCFARGTFFTDAGDGPFNSTEHLEAWFNRRLKITQNFKQAPTDSPQFRFNKLVLTNFDIAPRNLILDLNGKVRLIDWGFSGIYPEGFDFEEISIRRSHAPEFLDMVLELIPGYEDLSKQMRTIQYALTTAQWVDYDWTRE